LNIVDENITGDEMFDLKSLSILTHYYLSNNGALYFQGE